MSSAPSPIADAIASYVRKPKGMPLPETELKKVLKAKLTKKEYKIFFLRIDRHSEEEICQALRLDTARYRHLSDSIAKKLNKESVKQLLYAKDNDSLLYKA